MTYLLCPIQFPQRSSSFNAHRKNELTFCCIPNLAIKRKGEIKGRRLSYGFNVSLTCISNFYFIKFDFFVCLSCFVLFSQCETWFSSATEYKVIMKINENKLYLKYKDSEIVNFKKVETNRFFVVNCKHFEEIRQFIVIFLLLRFLAWFDFF